MRSVGIEGQHEAKQSKVCLEQKLDALELHLVYKGNADVFRIHTTAESKQQAVFAATYIAHLFEAEVQGV